VSWLLKTLSPQNECMCRQLTQLVCQRGELASKDTQLASLTHQLGKMPTQAFMLLTISPPSIITIMVIIIIIIIIIIKK